MDRKDKLILLAGFVAILTQIKLFLALSVLILTVVVSSKKGFLK